MKSNNKHNQLALIFFFFIATFTVLSWQLYLYFAFNKSFLSTCPFGMVEVKQTNNEAGLYRFHAPYGFMETNRCNAWMTPAFEAFGIQPF